MSTTVFPKERWASIDPAEAGFDAAKLNAVGDWMDQLEGDGRYRCAIVRRGRLVAEWNRGVDADAQVDWASAAKSMFSCMLAVAVEEGIIDSADAKLVDYYPEAVDVPEGEGPKPGRFARPKDRHITLVQLISNTSGYMKPNEEPGKVFHYQTFGMNVLTHAIAKSYGLYDVKAPEGSRGLKVLIDRAVRHPIGATWDYYQRNFKLHEKARINIFGYYDGIRSTALDMARLGWLWCNWGRWQDRQLIPEGWLGQAGRTAPQTTANCPEDQWCYGYGFWTNDHGKLWPDLPRDAYAARGAGRMHIFVCPSLSLVVALGPGPGAGETDHQRQVLERVVDSLVNG